MSTHKDYICCGTAVEAALRGDETPPRVDSLSLAPPLPAVPKGPRPPIPQHSSSTTSPLVSNGSRHGSPRTRADRPPPPVGRTESRDREFAAPPLPTRVSPMGKPMDSPPPLPPNRATSPGHREGPPLPTRGSLRSARPQPPPSSRSAPRTSSQGTERQDVRSPPTPSTGAPPRTGSIGVGGRGNVPAPPNRQGSRPQPPGRPGKPSLPNKPHFSKKAVQIQSSGGEGGGGGKGPPVSVPTPDGMTPREMVDFFIGESPRIISNVQDGVGNIPTLLENLVTLGEAIADQARGRSVQFRIQMSKFRSELGNLKTYANVAWYNSVNQIVSDIHQLVSGLKVLSNNLSE